MLKGSHHTKETKRKISLAKIGHPVSKETKIKIGLVAKRQIHSPNRRENARLRFLGKNNPMYGKKGKSNPFYGMKHTKETIKKIRFNKERNRKISEGNKGIPKPGKENAIKGSGKISEKRKEDWSNPEYRERQLKLILKGLRVKPNKLEARLGELINLACPSEYKYTGNGSLIICGLAPDYTNINGKKRVIEAFGDYWHKGQNPQDRIDKFEEFGYRCLVIWEHELKEKSKNELIETIRGFNNG